MDISVETKQIKHNLSYQVIYNILSSILPLITAPYLARTLGSFQQGIYSYTSSIVNYFTLFAMLGIVNHGIRCIAETGHNPKDLKNRFSSVFSIQIISTSIALVVYILYLMFICNNNKIISIIQTIAIISCYFDISWLFMGLEDFKFIVFRNALIKILTVVCILLFVNSQSDLWIYTLLMTLSMFISNAILWTKAYKMVKYKVPSKKDILKEIKPIMLLFIPLLAMSIYHIMDKTMLGILSNFDEVGFYYNADKVINIPICIIAGISTVFFPRSVALISKSESEYNEFFTRGLEIVIISSIALSFGIASISPEFTPTFFGKGFDSCIWLIICLSPVMIFKSISNAIRLQYLIPKKKEKVFIYSVILGALFNFGMNLILIPKYGSLGAVIGTLVAEIISCLFQLIYINNKINFNFLYVRVIVYLLIGGIMVIMVRLTSRIALNNHWLLLLLMIAVGGFVFITLLLLYLRLTNNKLLGYTSKYKKNNVK